MAILSHILSHWTHAFSYFQMSANDFYSETEKIIKCHDMPDVKTERAKHKEGGLLSASREYLRIKRGQLVIDVCAAPFGKDFFVSWWLYETETTMTSLFKFTKLGEYIAERAAKRTFFQADEEAMFKGSVHECILEAIEKVTANKNVRAIDNVQRQIIQGGV